jgi:predicted N-formylglutamate amidohydrolase
MIICKKDCQLLCEGDQSPYEVFAPDNADTEDRSPVLIVCDHASNYVPKTLNSLDIEAQYFAQHIAYDIGAANVSRKLAERLGASAVLAGFSRLVIDANRFLTAHDSVPTISDGITIKGNETLLATDVLVRIEELFIPYHDAINRAIARIRKHYSLPLIMSVHSYTPVFQGFERPWEIGVVWEGDDGVATMLMDHLRENTDYHVGDNEPYHACNPLGYTMKTHAESKHYPHVMVEIRQDLVADEKGQRVFADVLAAALTSIKTKLDKTIVKI